MINKDLVQIQKYREEFILPPKHQMKRKESGVQYIETCPTTGISKQDAETIVSLH